MSDYISRRSVMELVQFMPAKGGPIGIVPTKAVLQIPAADVQPVRHGRWVTREVLVNPIDGIWRTLVECSECGGEAFKHEAYGYQRDNFCHLCGADMREEQK